MSTSAVVRESDSNATPSTNKDFVREILGYESVLRACIYRFTRNYADVDELLQETYIRLLKGNLSSQGPVRSLRAFCLTVARNVTLDWVRHRDIISIDLLADLDNADLLDTEDSGEQVDNIINSQQELEQIAVIVAQLPAKCREVFTMRKVYGFSQKEIASKLGISENTVEQHLTKASRRCSEALFASETSYNGMFAQLRRRMRPKFGNV